MKFIFVCVCTAGLCMSTFVSSEEGKPINIVYYEDYKPYSYREKAKMMGVLIDISNELFSKKLNVMVTHKGYPWKRAQSLVLNGHADAFITAPTKERLLYTSCTKKPVLKSRYYIFVNKNNYKLSQIKQADSKEFFKSGLKLVSYIGNGVVEKELKGYELTWVAKPSQALRMIQANRADVFFAGFQSLYKLKELQLDNEVLAIPFPYLSSFNFNVCISKSSSHSKLIEVIDGFIPTLNFEDLYDKYE